MDDPISLGISKRDFSHKYIEQYTELQDLEKGIPYQEFYFHSRARDKDLEFRVLKKITETKEHSLLLVENSGLTCAQNRYADILPYKDTLVKLIDHSYINASFIDGASHGLQNMFIATQGPLRSTIECFWAMV